jgi:hypothetical protein
MPSWQKKIGGEAFTLNTPHGERKFAVMQSSICLKWLFPGYADEKRASKIRGIIFLSFLMRVPPSAKICQLVAWHEAFVGNVSKAKPVGQAFSNSALSPCFA